MAFISVYCEQVRLYSFRRGVKSHLTVADRNSSVMGSSPNKRKHKINDVMASFLGLSGPSGSYRRLPWFLATRHSLHDGSALDILTNSPAMPSVTAVRVTVFFTSALNLVLTFQVIFQVHEKGHLWKFCLPLAVPGHLWSSRLFHSWEQLQQSTLSPNYTHSCVHSIIQWYLIEHLLCVGAGESIKTLEVKWRDRGK